MSLVSSYRDCPTLPSTDIPIVLPGLQLDFTNWKFIMVPVLIVGLRNRAGPYADVRKFM